MTESKLIAYNGTPKELFESSKNKELATGLVNNYDSLNPEVRAKVKEIVAAYAKAAGESLPTNFTMQPIPFYLKKIGFTILEADGKTSTGTEVTVN